MLDKLKSIKNKLGMMIFGAAVAANAAATDQLDSLSTTLTTVSTKAEGISNLIIGIVLLGVVMAIVIKWARKGQKAG